MSEKEYVRIPKKVFNYVLDELRKIKEELRKIRED
jgi:DNA-binding protein